MRRQHKGSHLRLVQRPQFDLTPTNILVFRNQNPATGSDDWEPVGVWCARAERGWTLNVGSKAGLSEHRRDVAACDALIHEELISLPIRQPCRG